MTTHKKLMSLLITSLALLAAAVPSFGQAPYSKSRSEASATAAITVVEPLALGREHKTGDKFQFTWNTGATRFTPIKTGINPPSFSPFMFEQSLNRVSSGESSFIAPRTTIYDASLYHSRKQFRFDENTGPASRKSLSFIPSRGPKPPDTTIASSR